MDKLHNCIGVQTDKKTVSWYREAEGRYGENPAGFPWMSPSSGKRSPTSPSSMKRRAPSRSIG